MLTILAAPAGGIARSETAARLPELLGSSETVWADLQEPTPDEAKVLSEVFKFHPLAVEDCLGHANHPKIDDFGGYVYLVIHAIVRADKRGELKTVEVDCFLGRNYVVTVHDGGSSVIEALRKRFSTVEGAMGRGADWLLHALLDHLADSFLDVIERMDEEIDLLERTLFQQKHSPPRRVLAEVFALKKDVLLLKRVVHPARDVYSRIARGDFAVVRPEVAPHFRDVYDHIVRVAEMLESFRDVMTSALETYLSIVSQRTNEIMKVLTVVSAILMTTSLMAGIYGMNFEHLPAAGAAWGFWGMLGAMAAVSGAMFWVFRRQRWI